MYSYLTNTNIFLKCHIIDSGVEKIQFNEDIYSMI